MGPQAQSGQGTPSLRVPQDGQAKKSLVLSLLEEVSQNLASFGVRRKAASDSDYSAQWQAMPEKRLLSLLEYWRHYNAILQEIRAQGTEGLSGSQMVWRMLQRGGLTPTQDVLGKIEDDDVVEIYDLKNQQIFRNIKFFEYCSFSLEDLFVGDWVGLTKRESRWAERALTQVGLIQAGLLRTTLDMRKVVSRHRVTELRGEQLSYWIELKWGAPLRKKFWPAAYLVIHSTSWS